MPCRSPISLKEKKMNVPCGKCPECLESKRHSWVIRIMEELKASDFATFLTLTYDEDHVPKDKEGNLILDKSELQRYLKRVRAEMKVLLKQMPTIKKNISYYAVGEYGTEGRRPHYHAILFNALNVVLDKQWRDKEGNPIGTVQNDHVSEASISYVAKYLINPNDEISGVPSFAIMSKGIGKDFLSSSGTHHKRNMQGFVLREGGYKSNLPRYYRDKIFDADEKEIINARNIEKIRKIEASISPEKKRSMRKAKKIMHLKQKSNKV